jgi:hypothetical protein
MYKSKYFGIKELVSNIVYTKFGDFAWRFFDENVLVDLDAIRVGWEEYLKTHYKTDKAGIIINNYSSNLQQCGLRTNADPLVKAKTGVYCSGHCLAKAFDMHPVNGRYEVFYNFVCDFIKAGKTKVIKRVENFKSTPTWVHVDALRTTNGSLEIFSV